MNTIDEINRKISREMTKQVADRVEAILRATPGLDISAAEAINRLHARIRELESELEHARINAMNKHESNPGDRTDLVTPIPDHSEWVGKPPYELPEETVCDLPWKDSGVVSRVCIVRYGQAVYAALVDADDNPVAGKENTLGNFGPVIRIHKLGEVRPKRLRDEPGVWWQDDQGCVLCWVPTGGGTLVHFNGVDLIYPLAAHMEDSIGPNWTRLGPLEGIKVGGVFYGEGE